MEDRIHLALEKKLGAHKVLTGVAVMERYSHIWRMNEPLQAKAVVLPRTTEDVSATMKICHAHQQSVIIHGGLTGLVGSTESTKAEVVISMEKMNAIEEIDSMSRTMTVQSGVILESIQRAAMEKDLLFPLNFGARGSAQIGGAIATNAGGLRVFKYGMTRALVLGLEVVLADGTVISSIKKIIKDNSAYDLKQIFIGSEGTLGIVTRAVLRLVEAPKSRNSAFVACQEYAEVVRFLRYIDQGLGGGLSGFELLLKDTYRVLSSPPAIVKPPIPYDYPYYILLESLGSEPKKDRQHLQGLLEKAIEQGLIEEAIMAHNESDLNWFWTLREDVDVMVSQCDNDQHFDLGMPISSMGSYIESTAQQLKAIPEVNQCYFFGHIADGNLHLVVCKQEQSPQLIHQINEVVYRPVKALGGSVSAEHGIGVDKKRYLKHCRTREEIQLMQSLKQTLDPLNLLNRGRVIDVPDV